MVLEVDGDTVTEKGGSSGIVPLREKEEVQERLQAPASMVVVREVPLGGPSAKFATLDLSLNSLVPAGGELGFGSSCAVGDERFLTWRVCSHNNRQCLELFELCAHQELSGGCWRVLLPEAVVSVRCVPFAEDDVVVLVVVTSGGLRVARLPQPRNQEAALLQFLNTSARESPLASVAFAPKEGVHLTCADARVGERSEVEVFVGTTSGVTLSVSLPSDGSKAQVKSELRQASSGGFSLFRSPAKATGREQILCSVVCAGESVLTLSEDGKVKRWLGNGKCVVERVVSLDRPNGEGRLLACGIQCLPATEVAVFAMHPEDGDAPVLSLVACSWDRVGDFKPEHSVVECPVVAERLEHAQDGVPGVPADVVSFGPGVLDGDEVLLSVWQGVEDSVTCASSLVETGGRHLKWDTEAVRTQLWEMNGQLEVASLYLDRYQAVEGDEWRSKVPPPAVFMEDLLFRPRWFPTKTILSALDKLLQEHSVQPTSSMPDLHSAQGGMFDAVAVRSHVRRSLGDIALGRSDGETGVLWRDLVELCVNEWRATHDAPLGVSTVDLRSQVEGGGSCTLLVKRGGVSALRAASGTENLFLSLLAQAMSQGGMQGEAFSSSGSEDDDGLRIALQILEWAEVADPGGAIMTQRLMTEGAGLVLEDTLRAAMVENPAPQSVWCDPEAILGRFPEVLSLGAPSGGEGALCLSLQRHLGQLEAFAASQGQGQREHGIGWMEEAVEHACAQVVATHFEVVRSLALLLELLDYHCRSSGSADTSSLRNVLHGRVLPLLSSYHALRWASTKRGGGEGDRTLLSLSVEPVGAPLDLFGWGSREDSSPLLACVALPVKGRIEGRMLSSLYHSQHGGGLGAGTQGWEDLMALCEISYAGTGCKEDWVCEGALLLVKGLCLVQARRLGEAEQCFGKVSREARGCVREIEVLLRNVLGLRQDGRMLALQGRFAELVLSQRVREVIAELFVLHDRQHGLYEVIRDAAGKLCGPHDPQIKYDQAACVTCALRLGIASLSEIGARISALSAVCGDSPDELCALEAAAALAETSQDRLRLALAQQLVGIGHFDEAYNLCAPRFQFCNDLDIERLERLDSELPADDLQDVSMRLMPGAEDAVASLRDRRRQQNAYRCLRTFVSSPQFRKQLHRLCSYPWVGCGNTVDTLLRQLNDVPGDQLDIDTSYQARYAFNVARSDYRAAGDAMMTYCYNIIARNAQEGDHVPIDVLRKQMSSCLAAINSYSLIKETFAFWTPPQVSFGGGAPRLVSGRGRSESAGKRVISPSAQQGTDSHASSGWKASKSGASISAPDSLMRSGGQGGASSVDALDDSLALAVDSQMAIGPAPPADPGTLVTLATLRRHYTLLRCRVRLAESDPGARQRAPMPQRLVSLQESQMKALAEKTVGELLLRGLLEEALTLVGAFSLDCATFIAALTKLCLRATSGREGADKVTVRDELGTSRDPWEVLKEFLESLDGKRVVAGGEPNEMAPFNSRAGSHAFGNLHRIAGETILSWPEADVPLPPWLKRTFKHGDSQASGEVARFDAPGGDACGLMRLYLRYGKLQEAVQLVVECLDVDVRGSSAIEEFALMDLSSMRFVPYNLIDQLIHQLEERANKLASVIGDAGEAPISQVAEILACKEAVFEALQKWLEFVEKEAEIVREWGASDQVQEVVGRALREDQSFKRGGSGGDRDTVRFLVHKITSKLKQEVPFGQRLHRTLVSAGHGLTARADADRIFELLCLQLLQRSRGREAILPLGSKWQDFIHG